MSNNDTKEVEDLVKSGLYSEDPLFWECATEICASGLETYEAGPASVANVLWFLNEVCGARSKMVSAFNIMKEGRFKDAWLILEQVELALIWIQKNGFLNEAQYACGELRRQVSEWQKLYPYKVFGSPEFLIRREECSICGESHGPWSYCTHAVGKVYCGKLCYRIIRDADFLSLSLVTEPVQKYSVIAPTGPNGEDLSDYSILKYVVDRASGPFSQWRAEWTKVRHPHTLFADREKAGPCPCGSGRFYGECCMPEDGVLRPHLEVYFAENLPKNMQGIVLHGYENLALT